MTIASVSAAARWQGLTVAVTGMNNRPDNPGPGYAIARCLRAAEGFSGRIVGLGYDALDGGLFHATVCDAAYLLPYPSSGEAALLARLQQIHAEQRIDVLIPALDSELTAMSRLQPQLQALGIRLLLPSTRLIEMRAKDRLPELCARAEVATPPVKPITDPGFFLRCERDGWRYPLVVKGVFYDAIVAYSAAEAQAAFRKLADTWGLPVLVQPWLRGEEYNVAGVGDGEGGLIGAVMMRKRALTEKGKAWAGISIDCPPLLAATERLVAALQWPGPFEVEMLRDSDGEFHLIEINPRFPAWIYLSHGVGCNLPQALLMTLSDERPATLPAPQSGRMFIRYAEELIVDLERFEAMVMAGTLLPETPSLAVNANTAH